MYERFFFLNEKPFHITPDPRFLYLSKKHRVAIELLSFGIRERKGFILLSGEVGTGKTTLCRAILGKLPRGTESALILNPVLSGIDLLKTITADFGIKAIEDTPKGHIDGLNSFLLKLASSGGNAVVIIDEAQNLSPAALEMVRLLSNLETEKEKLLQIILVGQPELRTKLAMTGLRQLNQRIIIRHHLEPLDLEETREYIENRLAVAGGSASVEFTKDALKSIYSGAGGIPRMINILCDRALTAAFIEGKRVIDSKVLGKALRELTEEGYIGQPNAGAMRAELNQYTPYIVMSSFVIALVAGILWGPVLLRFAAGYLSV
ncbi:MAG TPA: AAA family ATPase [Thermodesulfobacteriota bacterium]